MKTRMFVGAFMLLPLLAACQQNEILSDGSVEQPVLNLEASVYAPERGSRTITDEKGSTSFVEEDALGFFMPEDIQPVKWTLDGSRWVTESSLTWKDKVNRFMFCAYYPYSDESATISSIPMPDLSVQTGTLSDIGRLDFLSARCETSYNETDNGTVAFTGESSFKHVYSLISITIKKDLEEENVGLSQAKFQGTNLFSRSTYHFGKSAEEDGLSLLESSPLHSLTLSYEEPVALSGESGYTIFLLCNPAELMEDSEFSIAYQRDGISYTASTKRLGKQFLSGKYYRFILRLTKEDLKLEGSEITNWIPEELPEIAVDEIPA